MKHIERPETSNSTQHALSRRELLTCTVPVCALACLGLDRLPALLAAGAPCGSQETHRFDVKKARELSSRDMTRLQSRAYITLIRTLRTEIGDEETVRLLNATSAAYGRAVGERHARTAPDTTFRSFTAQFRRPNVADIMTHEVVEDTENTFGLRVSECVWAEVFREAGQAGDIGHAAVCNVDYHWAPAFNPSFRLERTRTLMQGHDHCNHRYLSGADRR